jgi:tRNA nucleotidyltransferase (CCA-adding enzyme)
LNSSTARALRSISALQRQGTGYTLFTMSNSRVRERELPVSGDSALSRKARTVAETAQRAGGRALLVGGYVRDALLGLDPKDADIEVYGIEAAALRKLLNRLGRVNCVGESFRVYKLVWHEGDERYELDVSLPRRDKKTGSGHRGFEVEGDPTASVEDAARRRDFTVNAILCDPLNGEIIDPFGGRADLENRVLRAVDAAHFAEDSLRVLRAMQFAARFEMTIDPQTVELCRGIDLSDLPRERIWGEWEKMLLKAEKPSMGLRAAQQLRVLEKLFPDLCAAMMYQAELLCATLDAAARERDGLAVPQQNALMLAAMGVFLERGESTSKRASERLLDQFGVWTLNGYDVRAQVLPLVEYSMTPAEWFERHNEITDGNMRRLSGKCEPVLLWKLARSRGQREAAAWLKERMCALGVKNGPPAPLLLGRHLLDMGLKPGPRIGEITRAVYEMQLDGKVSTEEEALAAARRLIDEEL